MEYKVLPNQLKIPMIGMGTYPLKGRHLIDVLKFAGSAGYELYDTAHMYGNEGDIGFAIQNNILDRNKILITSKICATQYLGHRRYLHLDKQSVSRAYKNSCKLLGVDSIDIFLLHSPFKYNTKAYQELISLYDKGKVKAIGVSNFNQEQLDTLYKEVGGIPMINQIEIHPYNTMEDIIQYCNDRGIVVEAYSPFGRGNILPEIMNNETLIQFAQQHNKSVGQIILRWLVQQDIITVVRSSNPKRIQENLEIFDFSLTDEQMKYISSLNQNKGYGKHFQ